MDCAYKPPCCTEELLALFRLKVLADTKEIAPIPMAPIIESPCNSFPVIVDLLTFSCDWASSKPPCISPVAAHKLFSKLEISIVVLFEKIIPPAMIDPSCILSIKVELVKDKLFAKMQPPFETVESISDEVQSRSTKTTVLFVKRELLMVA